MNPLTELNRQRRLSRMRRAVVTAGQLHAEQSTAATKAAMITLTYRPDVEWRREHISLCLKAWRHELRGCKFRYVWVLELTKAGKPHYHVLVWLPPGRKLAMPDRSGAWPHGMSRVEWARNAVGYLVKYATKGCEGLKFPRGARLFGCGGLEAAARARLRWAVLPKYVREQFEPEDRVRRMHGGGWLAESTGEWLESASLVMPELRVG